MSRTMTRAVAVAALALATIVAPRAQQPPEIKAVTLDNGVTLHYVDRGSGVPVVFVHGSLSDGGYWSDEVDAFSRDHRAIAYSRRYNAPNDNALGPGYSAITDADDLAALVSRLGLGRVHIIGHSYGALAALFLAVRHPEIVRTLVLAEPPAVSLLDHVEGEQAAAGKAMLADIRTRMVAPMEQAFRSGDRERGVRTFIDYVFDDPHAWDRMPPSARNETMKNAREWEAMLVDGELFPELPPGAVRGIRAPALILTGERSYPFLHLVDAELARLLPDARHVVLRGATHQMWIEQPEACRRAVLDLWRSAAATGEHGAALRSGAGSRQRTDRAAPPRFMP